MKILISTHEDRVAEYIKELSSRASLSDFQFTQKAEPKDVDVIIYEPSSALKNFEPFENLKLVQSIWAGVDSIEGNLTLKAPLCRMVDAGLVEGMREYVLGHILADHLKISKYSAQQKENNWDDSSWLPLARNVTIGIIGVGNLGKAVGDACLSLGFNVLGWARTEKQLDFPSFHGQDKLYDMLTQCDYIVTLLPATTNTRDIIDEKFLAAMKRSAILINPGRGALLDEDALIDALDQKTIRRAILDVFKIEPLPTDHPFWMHNDILITPHIAAKSRVDTACDTISENLTRLKNGAELLHLVDRKNGY